MHEITVKEVDGLYVVGCPDIGALSVFNDWEYLVFIWWRMVQNQETDPRSLFAKLYTEFGITEEEALINANSFHIKLSREGWFRSGIPAHEDAGGRLASVYFTVTRRCNLSCPYCYQGFHHRAESDLPVLEAERILEEIQKINPQCNIVITGGEPFMHPGFFDILDVIESKRLPFAMITNGTLITPEIAHHLTQYAMLVNIQISLDGYTETTHAITRGRAGYARTMAGIHQVIASKLPFSLAPTLHNGNLHEAVNIACLAFSNEGSFSPNNFRNIPGNPDHSLQLDPKQLHHFLKEGQKELVARLGAEKVKQNKGFGSHDGSNSKTNRCYFCCGLGCSTLDIDSNGDVYPCHLLKEPKFILGNALSDSLQHIYQKTQTNNPRTYSYDIPKCKSCMFVSVCGGGCRAAAYNTYGSLYREDDLCELLYESTLENLIVNYKFNRVG